ncbi:MAG: FkbM family methyltransferase, partial [Gammaproteobacteria bacterium]|nr:FkbM family methyltransferase [Gammaproteobacteria bacterium]
MRTSGWMKRQPWFWPVKRFIKRISGKELWLKTEVEREVLETGGWIYIPGILGPASVVYSLGVGDSIDFDMDLIHQFSLTVHAFDPTPFSEEWIASLELPANFVFHAWAAAGKDGSLRLFRRVSKRGRKSKVMWTAEGDAGDDADFIDAPAYTIRSMMEKLGHEKIDVLKIDVEGAEYEILDGFRKEDQLPTQLLVEFHHRFPGIGKQRTAT